jgi:hypothetical protein
MYTDKDGIPSMERWRHILERQIEDPKEKKRIAQAIGVISPRTLNRWTEGVSTPKNSRVIRALQQTFSSAEMDAALLDAFPDIFMSKGNTTYPQKSERGEIPLEFYKRLLHAYTTIQPNLRKWTIKNLVCRQMIHQIDPDSLGILLVCVQVIKEHQNLNIVVQIDGWGTNIWDTKQIVSQSTQPISSFVGEKIITGYPYFIQVISQEQGIDILQPLEFFWRERIQSMAIYPVTRSGAVAGGIICCSTQQDFFSLSRKEIIDEYIHLLGLAFTDQDFVGVQKGENSLA